MKSATRKAKHRWAGHVPQAVTSKLANFAGSKFALTQRIRSCTHRCVRRSARCRPPHTHSMNGARMHTRTHAAHPIVHTSLRAQFFRREPTTVPMAPPKYVWL